MMLVHVLAPPNVPAGTHRRPGPGRPGAGGGGTAPRRASAPLRRELVVTVTPPWRRRHQTDGSGTVWRSRRGTTWNCAPMAKIVEPDPGAGGAPRRRRCGTWSSSGPPDPASPGARRRRPSRTWLCGSAAPRRPSPSRPRCPGVATVTRVIPAWVAASSASAVGPGVLERVGDGQVVERDGSSWSWASVAGSWWSWAAGAACPRRGRRRGGGGRTGGRGRGRLREGGRRRRLAEARPP